MSRRMLFLLATLVAIVAEPALAQQPTQAQLGAIRSSCRSDYQAHCSSVPTGGKPALACLEQNAASLSPSCQHAVAAVSGGGGAAPSSAPAAPASRCQQDGRAGGRGWAGAGLSPRLPDAVSRCAAGGGGVAACLADHEASLSPNCARALSAARGAR